MKTPPIELVQAVTTSHRRSGARDILGDWYAENITAPRIVNGYLRGFVFDGGPQGIGLDIYVPGDPRLHYIIFEDHSGRVGEWYSEVKECEFIQLSMVMIGRYVRRLELAYSVDQHELSKVLAEWVDFSGPEYKIVYFAVDGRKPRFYSLNATELVELCK